MEEITTQTEQTAQQTPEVAIDNQQVATDTTQMSDQQAPPAYTPSYKFKYTGKRGEKYGDAEGEFDDFIRESVKSKEHEDKLRSLYAKAYGLEFTQHQRDNARNELKNYRETWNPIIETAQKATQAFQRGDMDMFFEQLGVPANKIQQYVLSKLQMQDMPADQRAIVEQNQNLQRQQWLQQQELQKYQQQFQQSQTEILYNQLQAELSKPEISSIAKSFDSRNGEGAFENAIKQHGHYIYVTQNGRVANPAEVLQEVIKTYGLRAETQAQTDVAKKIVQPGSAAEVPVIPVVKGSGSAPVSRAPKNLNDLKKIRSEKYGY